MRFAQKSIALLSFCLLLNLPAWAGSAPTDHPASTPKVEQAAAPTDYSPAALYSRPQATRRGGMLWLVGGIALMFLSPLVLERVHKAV